MILAEGCSPPGALIIGLGHVGEGSPAKVRLAVREAALKYAVSLAEAPCSEPDSGWRAASVTSLLIGTTGGGALSIADSVRAIVQGILEANQVLFARKLWNQVRIPAIEFIELYEAPAAEAVRAAQDLQRRLAEEDGARQGLVVEKLVRTYEGGRYLQPANHYATGWARRMLIEEPPSQKDDGQRELKFTILTDRARTEESLGISQRKLVDQYLEQAVRTPSYDEAASATLYDLLVPLGIKERSETTGANLVLVLDGASAAYPWELLGRRTPSGVKPLSLQIQMVRQFRTNQFREHPRQPRQNNVLVVGDTESGLAELPGAQREAREVARVLEAGGMVVSGPRIKPKAMEVVTELFAREYKVLHLAGHGEFDPEHPDKSGMILGNGIHLTAAEVRQMSVVPELVFLNCCHIGQLGGPADAHKLAASIARELINIGVKAVVAAGWAVDDGAAAAFARQFYQRLFAGDNFGCALLSARLAAFHANTGCNTWGAYQAYGNPDYRLNPAIVSRVSDSGEWLASRGEYISAFRSLSGDAKAAQMQPEEIARLKKRVQHLCETLPRQWRDGEMLSLSADAWAAVNEFGEAIPLYRQALAAPDSQAPFRTAEQLMNLLGRHAVSLSQSDPKGKQAAALFLEAQRLADVLNRFGESSERWSLQGGLYKRAIQFAPRKAQRKYLRRAFHAYNAAQHHEQMTSGTFHLYSAINAATYRWLLNGADADFKNRLSEIEKHLPSADGDGDQSFWVRIHRPDFLLLRLLGADSKMDVETVAEAYLTAFKGGATAREVDSVVGQIGFMHALVKSSTAKRPAQLKALTRLKATLEGIQKKEAE